MEEFLRFLLIPLLTQPQDLVITPKGNFVVVKVADRDTGRIIGKKGIVINALRILVRTWCTARKQPLVNLVLDTPAIDH